MIYLDYAASSPLSDKAMKRLEESLPLFGNPSSNHAYGRKLNREIDDARNAILKTFGLSPSSFRVIFVSSATEGNNLVLKGIAKQYSNRGRKILSSVLEHPSVTNPLEALKREGFDVSFLAVEGNGKVSLPRLEESIDKETILVSLIGTNNEVGSVNDLPSIASIVRKYPKAFLHMDMTQAVGKTAFDYSLLDAFTCSAHKFGGPKGVGILIAKKNIVFSPLLDGGEQEYGFRSGTLNYPGIMATKDALIEAMGKQKENEEKARSLWCLLYEELSKNPEIVINSPLDSSPFIFNFSLVHKKASVLVEALSEEGIYVSSVSACNSKQEPISNVLLAMGRDEELARNSIRVSFGEKTTLEEAKQFLLALNSNLERLVNR